MVQSLVLKSFGQGKKNERNWPEFLQFLIYLRKKCIKSKIGETDLLSDINHWFKCFEYLWNSQFQKTYPYPILYPQNVQKPKSSRLIFLLNSIEILKGQSYRKKPFSIKILEKPFVTSLVSDTFVNCRLSFSLPFLSQYNSNLIFAKPTSNFAVSFQLICSFIWFVQQINRIHWNS